MIGIIAYLENFNVLLKIILAGWAWWFTPVNSRYLKGGGRRITVQGQSRQKHEILCEKQTKSRG
jgi:hypothetical protein